MKLGTENKKATYALVLLGAIALYCVYNAFFAGPSAPTPSTPAASTAAPSDTSASLAAAKDAAALAKTTHRAPTGGRSDEFKPRIGAPKDADDRRIAPAVDPTLRLDLLAKLEKVPAPAGTHNLFQVGPPPVKAELPKGTETQVPVEVAWNHHPPPLPTPTPPPGPPPPKQPVPINVKYYGWAAPSGTATRRAFFLDGDDIIIRAEGEAIKGHYRVVRIEAGRVVIEDTNDKLQQTLTKVEDAL